MPDHPPPRVSTEDLRQILITMAYPTFRYGFLTHGAHKARFHTVAIMTGSPDDVPDVLAPPGSKRSFDGAPCQARQPPPARRSGVSRRTSNETDCPLPAPRATVRAWAGVHHQVSR